MSRVMPWSITRPTTTYTDQLQTYANGIASAAPYGLVRERFSVEITVAATQRVTGANEYNMHMTYDVPTFLSILGMDDIPLTYDRPVFVISS